MERWQSSQLFRQLARHLLEVESHGSVPVLLGGGLAGAIFELTETGDALPTGISSDLSAIVGSVISAMIERVASRKMEMATFSESFRGREFDNI